MRNFIKIFSALLCISAMLVLSSCAYTENGGTTDSNHAHKVLHWEVVDDVGCEEAGKRFGTCIDCMNEVRDEQAALGHDYRGGACVRCGRTEEAEMAEKELFSYTLSNDGNGYILKSMNDEYATHVVIPAEYCGLPVVYINASAFAARDALESVVIPDSVKEIGSYAFANCTNLRYVTIGKGTKSLGEHAFSGCKDIREIILPDTLEIIGDYCFYGCINLEHTEANGCRTVGEGAFKDCERLYSFDFSDKLGYIGKSAFENSSLVSVNIPGSVTYLGGNAFRGTTIKSVRIASGITSKEAGVFIDCNMLETAFVETNNIRNEFYNCPNLKTIVFSEGVSNIDIEAIARCEALETVYLPRSLTFMGETFYGVSSLKKIVYTGTSEEWLALRRNFYWSFMNEDCVIECSDRTLTRDELRQAESID